MQQHELSFCIREARQHCRCVHGSSRSKQQGRARQGRAKQGRAGRFELVGDLEAVDGVWVANVVLHQASFPWGDATGVRHQLDTSPSR